MLARSLAVRNLAHSHAMSQTYSSLPWGKNFRTLPAVIEAGLTSINEENFVVGCEKRVTAAEIAAGSYAHLKLTAESKVGDAWTSLIPSPNVGRTSHRNASVLEEPVKTQGKERKRIEGRAPDWKGGGLHTIHYWRDVWPRRLIVPAMSHLAFRRVGEQTDEDTFVLRFQIQEVLHKAAPDFRDEILRCVNLLQENVGTVGLLTLDAAGSNEVRNAAENIGWEVLPNAGVEETLRTVVQKFGEAGEKNSVLRRKAQERLDLINRLGPQRLLQGSAGFAGYFAAVFTDDLMVFENLELDHALYVIRGDWQELSRLTRTELRVKFADHIERIVHTTGWEDRLTRLVKQARGETTDPQAELF